MRLIKAVGVLLLVFHFSWAKFDPCRFNFGMKLGSGNISDVDIVAQYTWQGNGLESDIAQMLSSCKNNNQTPALYMYIIAKSSGLGDCNTGGGLCAQGAAYIRNNKEKIKGIYKSYATSIKNSFGTTEPILLFMEPDYFQYAQPGTQGGNPLSYQEAGQFIGDCIDIMKAELPNALVSLDLSPWIEDQGQTNSWLNALPLSKVDYMNTSGGISQAGSTLIKSDNRLAWKTVHDITKKCIIADAGYGAGGGGTGHDGNWDNVSNVNNRINDGVVAIIQFSPKSDWGTTIKSIKGQLSKPICSCTGTGSAKKFTLTVNAGTGGKVTRSPDAESYDSGATVTLTATANSGFNFKAWGGDVSGTAATVTVPMNANKTVSATFTDPKAKPTYTLSVTAKGSGMVTVSPNQAVYDSGTTVTLEVLSVNGGVFSGWSGALSGTATLATLTMNTDKSVTATFSGNDVQPAANLLKNGDFSDNDANWDFGAYASSKATGTVESGAFKVAIETPGGENWNIQLTQAGIALTKGEEYVLTFTASAQSAMKLIVNVGMPSGDYTSYSQEHQFDLAGVAKKFEMVFTMNETSTGDARIEFNSGMANSTWKIDDISLAVKMDIGVKGPAPFGINRRADGFYGGNERVSVSWYDYRGRLLQQRSGDVTALMRDQTMQFPGGYIAVVRIGSRTIIKRTVALSK